MTIDTSPEAVERMAKLIQNAIWVDVSGVLRALSQENADAQAKLATARNDALLLAITTVNSMTAAWSADAKKMRDDISDRLSALKSQSNPTPATRERECDHAWQFYQFPADAPIRQRCSKCWAITDMATAQASSSEDRNHG